MRVKENKEKNYILINSVIGTAYQVVTLVLGMVFRRVFIIHMGAELSGLTGLYSNIVDMVNLCLAGIGVSALHKLYICNANADTEGEQKILHFTLYFYRVVACIMFAVGIFCAVFIQWFINESSYSVAFLRMVFLVQMLSQCISNVYLPYRFLLQAKEKNYIVSLVRIVTDVIYYSLQISTIILYENYYIYLVLFGLRFIIQNLVVAIYARNRYRYPSTAPGFKWKEFFTLFRDIKDTIILQISNFIYLSTDSIILSKFTDLLNVNLYNNYMVIMTAADSFFGEVNASIQSNVGNKLAQNDDEESILHYLLSSLFIIHFLASIVSVGLYCSMGDFVQLWYGNEYVLSISTTMLLCLDFYWKQINYPIKNVLNASGQFELDKKITFIAAIFNIVTSMIMCHHMGINGVIIGTLLSDFVMVISRMIFYVCKTLKKRRNLFVKRFFYTQVVFLLEFVLLTFINQMIRISNSYYRLFTRAFVSVGMIVILNIIMFWKCDEMKLLKKLVMKWRK